MGPHPERTLQAGGEQDLLQAFINSNMECFYSFWFWLGCEFIMKNRNGRVQLSDILFLSWSIDGNVGRISFTSGYLRGFRFWQLEIQSHADWLHGSRCSSSGRAVSHRRRGRRQARRPEAELVLNAFLDYVDRYRYTSIPGGRDGCIVVQRDRKYN